MRRNWGEYDPAYLAMSDKDIRLEAARIYFYDIQEAKRKKGDKSPITITEVDGDDAFNEWVDAGMPDDDWEVLA